MLRRRVHVESVGEVGPQSTGVLPHPTARTPWTQGRRSCQSRLSVVALVGVGSLFSLYRVSRLLERVAPSIRGRLLVLFPGDRDGSNYRMLEAQDGWNYLATPIAPTEDMA